MLSFTRCRWCDGLRSKVVKKARMRCTPAERCRTSPRPFLSLCRLPARFSAVAGSVSLSGSSLHRSRRSIHCSARTWREGRRDRDRDGDRDKDRDEKLVPVRSVAHFLAFLTIRARRTCGCNPRQARSPWIESQAPQHETPSQPSPGDARLTVLPTFPPPVPYRRSGCSCACVFDS